MALKVSESTISKTTRCDKDFLCLKENTVDLCKVQQAIDLDESFIECMEAGKCNYQFSFGISCICRCPVRKEIFHKYNV